MQSRRTIATLIALLLATVPAVSFQEEIPTYVAAHSFTLSGNSALFSIVSPARTQVRGLFSGAVVICGAATTITQEIGGTASGGASVSAVAVNTTLGSSFLVSQGGTHSGGTTVGGTIDCAAGEKVSIDLTDLRFSRDIPSVQTYAIKTGAATGTIRVSLKWRERSR